MPKTCVHCQEERDSSEFYKHQKSRDGLGSWCKLCLKERSRAKRREQGIPEKKKNPEKRAAWLKQYRRKRRENFQGPSEDTRTCIKCSVTKSIWEFKFAPNAKGCYTTRCKACLYEDNKGRAKEYRVENWPKILLTHARRHNSDVTITEEWIMDQYEEQGGKCFWFNVPLVPSPKKKFPQQPSLDRLDRSKGYTPDNVVITCYAANIGRNENDVDTFADFIQVLRRGFSEK